MKKLYYISMILILALCITSCQKKRPNLEGRVLAITDWEFEYNGEWYPAFVPSFIHTDLQFNGLIPNPFLGTNEDSVQWVSDSTWTYRLVFDANLIDSLQHAELVFTGVTGYAEFYLNDKPLLNQEGHNYTDNSFRTWRFPIPLDLKEKDNTLIVKFIPAQKIIDQRKKALPYTLPDERVFLRTPPYQGGWDWGPKLVTCGLSKIVYLEQWKDFIIQDLNVRQNNLSEEEAHILVSFDLQCEKDSKVDIKYFIDDRPVKVVNGATISKGEDNFTTGLTIKNPRLWYPNGMGEQNLYNVKVEVSNSRNSKEAERRIGLRTIELCTDTDCIGSAFKFIVNGKPLFIKGVNWIPADFFPTNIKTEQYKNLLQSCKDANMNMIRVWGGGIYERKDFYDYCDEMGLLVWQDFMYACALYPGDSTWMYGAEMESIDVVKNLRNHPCIAIWCGNNEVKNGWDDWGWKDNYSEEQQTEIHNNMLHLFDTVLRQTVKFYDPDCPYISTSPLWGWGHPECCTEGDSHYWGVWWGELPFEMWEEKTGRFMAEYGFQSYPNWHSIQNFASANEQVLTSATMQNHQKHARGVQIISKAMEQYFYVPKDLKTYSYVSQLVQAYGTGWALEVHRRRQPHCMGTLFWQLNDCWPVASWSSIDYYGNWKALQYEAQRQYAPVILTTAPRQKNVLPIYAVNDSLQDIKGHLSITLCNFSGKVVASEDIGGLTLPAQSSSLLTNYQLPSQFKIKQLSSHYLLIRFYNNDNQTIAEKIYYYLYPKEMKFTSTGIKSTVKRINTGTKDEQFVFTLTANELKYGVEISVNAVGRFSDNFVTLLPGETKEIVFIPNKRMKTQLLYSINAYETGK